MPKANAALKLGRQVPEPAAFNPTKTWIQHPYAYRYDSALGICKRTAIVNSARTGAGYFRVEAAPKLSQRGLRQPAILRPAVRRKTVVSAVFAVVFMLAGAVLVYPFVPEIRYRLSHHPTLTPAVQLAQVSATQPAPISNRHNRVIIPSIGVNSPILESSSLAILDTHEGVWHQTGTLASSNFVIAGHRFKYLPPNTTTFYNLDKLKSGDVIVVDWEGKRSIYTVSGIRTVKAGDISVIAPTTEPQLTIYTCSDKRETERIVVAAKPLPQDG